MKKFLSIAVLINIKYFVLAQINVPLSTPVTTRFYIEESTTNNGTVTLQ